MTKVHNGVIIPQKMTGGTPIELDAYAEHVKSGNRAFADAYFELEDRANALGIDLERAHTDSLRDSIDARLTN